MDLDQLKAKHLLSGPVTPRRYRVAGCGYAITAHTLSDAKSVANIRSWMAAKRRWPGYPIQNE